MKLYKKEGRKYIETRPAEIIHEALSQIRRCGHADLAAATELKIINALFPPEEVHVHGKKVLP